MVDALVLEASTSVCGFESHLPHQKKRAPKGAFFFCCQGIWHSQMPPAAAGTSASLHVWQEPAVLPHTPPPFFVIPYSLRLKLTAPATGRGLEPNCAPGFFLCPKFAPPPAKSKLTALPTGFPKTAFPESVPQSGTPKLFTLPYSLAPLRPSPPTSRERQRTALSRGAEDQFPGGNAGLQNALSPRTAPHARHRLILNPCRRAAHRNYSLFTLLYSLSQPCSFFPPGRTAKQKYILFFGRLTHNSVRYNIGLNLIMEGKEYGKTGSA